MLLSRLFVGLQNLSLRSIGPGHAEVLLRHFAIAGQSRYALGLVRLLFEKLGFLHRRPPWQLVAVPQAQRDGLSRRVRRAETVPESGHLPVPRSSRHNLVKRSNRNRSANATKSFPAPL